MFGRRAEHVFEFLFLLLQTITIAIGVLLYLSDFVLVGAITVLLILNRVLQLI